MKGFGRLGRGSFALNCSVAKKPRRRYRTGHSKDGNQSLTSHRIREYGGTLAHLMRALDVALVVAAGFASYVWRHTDYALPEHYWLALLLAALLVMLIFPAADVYRALRGRSFSHEIRRLTLAWAAVLASLFALAFVSQRGLYFSRLWMGAWAVSGWTLLVSGHALVRHFLRLAREKGWGSRRILVVGAGDLGSEVARKLRQNAWTGLQVAAFVDTDPTRVGTSVEGVPVRGTIDDVDALLDSLAVQEVWLALPLRAEDRIQDILYQLRHRTVAVRFVPDIFEFRLLNRPITEVAGMPLLDLNVSPMVGMNRLLKSLEDYALAGLLLALTTPLMIAIALAVKVSSPGPVLFRQLRHGWDGRPFTIYKFRTMVVHDEPTGVASQAVRGDPRITRIGAVLRRTSLDELPQLVNVLQGHMSLVGPRPHALEHNEAYKDMIDAYMQRHRVKPGMTGWAQVNGLRGETGSLEKMRKRVEYDLYYIEHWSLWFDLKIIMLTVAHALSGHNAY